MMLELEAVKSLDDYVDRLSEMHLQIRENGDDAGDIEQRARFVDLTSRLLSSIDHAATVARYGEEVRVVLGEARADVMEFTGCLRAIRLRAKLSSAGRQESAAVQCVISSCNQLVEHMRIFILFTNPHFVDVYDDAVCRA